jgi:hypothetical protein
MLHILTVFSPRVNTDKEDVAGKGYGLTFTHISEFGVKGEGSLRSWPSR